MEEITFFELAPHVSGGGHHTVDGIPQEHATVERPWSLTAGLMAADEMLRWHERLGSLGSAVSSALGFTIPTYAWLLSGTVLAVGLLALVGLWVKQLPPRVRRGVIAGASMYVLGALGAEAVSGWIDRLYGIGHAYNAITTIEEGLEMFGCIVVIAALLPLVRVADDDDAAGRSVAVAPVEALTTPRLVAHPAHHGADLLVGQRPAGANYDQPGSEAGMIWRVQNARNHACTKRHRYRHSGIGALLARSSDPVRHLAWWL